MAAVLTLYRTSIGKKAVMAITGLIGYGFVFAHMIGNLKVFEGQEGFNAYAEFLRTVGEPAIPRTGLLWILRIVLVTAVILHVVAAIQLTQIDLGARSSRYARVKRTTANFASLTLRWGGIAIFLFLVYHLLHFTLGPAHPNFIYGDAYHNVVVGFQNPIAVGVYLLAMFALAMHLYHGVWSMFQTLGLNNYRWNGVWRGLAIVSALVLFFGFSLVPISVLAGLITI